MEAYYEHSGNNRTKVGLYLSKEDIEHLKLHSVHFNPAAWLNNPIRELIDIVLEKVNDKK